MRPLRFLLLLAFFVVLPVFLTCWSLFSAQDGTTSSLKTGYSIRSSRLRALFSFTSPSSLFPPSAVISLTNDNSTFFLARPAAFGPVLPSIGLSGQLWVGKGFGDEAALRGEDARDIRVMGWELGCSDVPGWAGDEHTRHEKLTKEGLKSETKDHESSRTNTMSNIDSDSADKHDDGEPSDDGTDDYLHHPHPDSNPATPARAGEPANVDPKDKPKKPTHADIESLQESAVIAGKIVMLARGGCGFLEKVKWAQRRGGIAVIVGDNERGAPLTIMYAKGDTSNVTIPALFTSYTSAHLLSSLVPSESHEDDETGKKGDQSSHTGHDTSLAVKSEPGLEETDKSKIQYDEKGSWIKDALSAIGLKDNTPFSHSEDSRRPPSSGNIDWVLLEDWDEDVAKFTTTNKAQLGTVTGTATLSTSLRVKSSPSAKPNGDDFIIGVQDWRDTDLVAPKSTPSQQTGTAKVGSTSGSANPATETKLKGGSITPGSGEYDHQNLAPGNTHKDDSTDHRASKNAGSVTKAHKDRTGSWFSFFNFAQSSEDTANKLKPAIAELSNHQVQNEDKTKSEKDDKKEREGLWVTLTPTSVSASPFFDTLLVLVISPLVTLTVVYGLLLLRSRIRRRRWRAPKSVVDRLPVRTYHTMATTSSTTSRQIASPDNSSATSPLLQPAAQDLSRRPRPRSQTVGGDFAGSATDGQSPSLSQSRSPPLEKPVNRVPKRRKYTGRQVECVVCLEEYVDGESRVMSLPCGHEFHAECITPWLVNRRRTCPICKGDVVRSFTRTGADPDDTDQREDDEQTSDDIQQRAAQTINNEPSAAIPIPVREDEQDADEDVERGHNVDDPLLGGRPSGTAQAGWRNIIGASLSRLSGETVWRQTPVDRSR